MTYSLKIISLLFILSILTIITIFVRKKKILVKYSIIWYLTCLFLLILVLFPNLLNLITNLLGIQIASNMIFALIIGFLFVITISLSIIVSEQKEQIKLLIQEVSLLKEKK